MNPEKDATWGGGPMFVTLGARSKKLMNHLLLFDIFIFRRKDDSGVFVRCM